MSMEYFSGYSGEAISFGAMGIISIIAVAIFIHGMYVNMRKWGYGSEGYGLTPEDGSIVSFIKTYLIQLSEHSHAPRAEPIWKAFIMDIVFQRRILRKHPVRWFMHMTIFYGWMVLAFFSGLMFFFEVLDLAHISPIAPVVLREMLQIPNEIFSYILLVGVVIATVRRLFVPKIRNSTSMSDTVLLGGLIIVVVTGFVSQGIRLGGFWGFGLENSIAPPSALFHSVISLLFCIALIPYTKYIHIIATPLTILLNKGGE